MGKRESDAAVGAAAGKQEELKGAARKAGTELKDKDLAAIVANNVGYLNKAASATTEAAATRSADSDAKALAAADKFGDRLVAFVGDLKKYEADHAGPPDSSTAISNMAADLKAHAEHLLRSRRRTPRCLPGWSWRS
eukprot:c19735_g2_i2.p3 GENE.c19735_g2_i2~~c19735_g2_i2.p3  ORF type:complete len:137 (-),score=34.00 c19735_g2_i2:360-770(-)